MFMFRCMHIIYSIMYIHNYICIYIHLYTQYTELSMRCTWHLTVCFIFDYRHGQSMGMEKDISLWDQRHNILPTSALYIYIHIHTYIRYIYIHTYRYYIYIYVYMCWCRFTVWHGLAHHRNHYLFRTNPQPISKIFQPWLKPWNPHHIWAPLVAGRCPQSSSFTS